MTVYDAAAVRDLLARTAGLLPTSKDELMAVLTEYRHALVGLAVTTDQPAAPAEDPGTPVSGGGRRDPRRTHQDGGC
jgi:hypothetical protein